MDSRVLLGLPLAVARFGIAAGLSVWLASCGVGTITTGTACSNDEDCAQLARGICVQSQCKSQCDRDKDCRPNETCENDVCEVQADAACDRNELCTTAPECKLADGATCWGAACHYRDAPQRTPCHYQATLDAPPDGLCRAGGCYAPGSVGCLTNLECGEQVCISPDCVDPSGLGGPCDAGATDGNDCATGLACVEGNCLRIGGEGCLDNSECVDTCIDDHCALASSAGGPCDAQDDADCGTGLVCNASFLCENASPCDTNAACVASGMTCIGGFCRRASPTGGACDISPEADSADCAPLNLCLDGTCRRVATQSCVSASQCASDFCEGAGSGVGVCKTRRGGVCESTDECALPWVCRGEPVTSCMGCTANSDCLASAPNTICRRATSGDSEATCVARGEFGVPCDTVDHEADCGDGLNCDLESARCVYSADHACANNDECWGALVCRGSKCQATGDQGAVCDEPIDCTSGLCVNNVCEAGATCTTNDDCQASGGVCRFGSPAATVKTCNARGALDARCDEEDDCASGLSCKDGVCLRKPGVGCNNGEECASGFCTDAVCCSTACSGNCDRCDTSGDGTCVADSARCTGSCDVCDATTGNCKADESLCLGNCDVCSGSGTSFSCAASDAACTGNCVRCTGSGDTFNCSANDSACTGNCDACNGSGTNFNCEARGNLCGGNCSTCLGANTEFNCGANSDACTGDCDVCSGSGTSYSCQASAGLCSGTCPTCSGSGTSFNCGANQSACSGNCVTCSGTGTTYNCQPTPTSCSGNCATCSGSGSSYSCQATPGSCSGNCATCDGSDTTFNCKGVDSSCTGNCDYCNGSGTTFNCAPNDGACTGTCDTCSGSGNSYSCAANGSVCSGNCVQCTGSGTNYSCGPTSACTGNCASCTVSNGGLTYSCTANSGACGGNCAVCSGGGTSYSCTGDNNACTGNCDTCSGSGTSFSCTGVQSSCSDCYDCTGSGTSYSCSVVGWGATDGGCTGTEACYGGACLLRNGEPCTTGTQCGTGNCTCMSVTCGVKECTAQVCGQCEYLNGSTCTNLNDGPNVNAGCDGGLVCLSGTCMDTGWCVCERIKAKLPQCMEVLPDNCKLGFSPTCDNATCDCTCQ